MNDDRLDSFTQPSRRQLLGLIGAAAVFPLAGCLGDDDNGTPTPTPTPGTGTPPTPDEFAQPLEITFLFFNESDEHFLGNVWFVREPFQGVTITDFDGGTRQVNVSTVLDLWDAEVWSDIAEMEIHGTTSEVVTVDIPASADHDQIVSIWSDMSIFFTLYPQQEPHGNATSFISEKPFLGCGTDQIAEFDIIVWGRYAAGWGTGCRFA